MSFSYQKNKTSPGRPLKNENITEKKTIFSGQFRLFFVVCPCFQDPTQGGGGFCVFFRLCVFRESFCESGEGVRLPRDRGLTSGEVRELPGKFGELPGKFGKLPGESVVAGRFHSERTSGEVAEKLPGKFGGLLGKSGDFPEARGSLTPSHRLAKLVSNVCVCVFFFFLIFLAFLGLRGYSLYASTADL